MATIPVIVGQGDENEEGHLGVLTPGTRLKNLDIDKLRESITNLSDQISSILQNVKKIGDFRLNQVQVSVEISAEGGVALIGSAKAAAKGAIVLTFSI